MKLRLHELFRSGVFRLGTLVQLFEEALWQASLCLDRGRPETLVLRRRTLFVQGNMKLRLKYYNELQFLIENLLLLSGLLEEILPSHQLAWH